MSRPADDDQAALRPDPARAARLLPTYFLQRTDVLAYATNGGTPCPVEVVPERLDLALQGHVGHQAVEGVILGGWVSKQGHSSQPPRWCRLGSYTLDPQGSVRWACIDCDGGGHHGHPLADPLATALLIVRRLRAWGFEAHLESSGSGKGWHVWLFFAEPLPAARVRRVLLPLLAAVEARLADGEPATVENGRGLELFPKQDTLAPGQVGNMVWLPWWHGAAPGGNLFHLVDDSGPPRPYLPDSFTTVPCAVLDRFDPWGPSDAPPDDPAVLRPGDAFNRTGPGWADLLPPGWTEVSPGRWRRPGKATGISATADLCKGRDGTGLFYCFTSSAPPLTQNHAYSKFAIYTLVRHQGDWKAAAGDLGKAGYGSPRPSSSGAPTSTPTACYRPLPPYRPFPVEALPEPLAAFVSSCAAAMQCDPTFVALPALAVTASVIGTTRKVLLKRGWLEPCVFWTLALGESGQIKSPPYRAARRPLDQLQQQLFDDHEAEARRRQEEKSGEAGAGKGKGDKDEEQEPAPRLLTMDATIESVADLLADNARGLLVTRDELSAWFKSFTRYKAGGASDLPHWLELFHGGLLLIDRKTGGKKLIRVPHAAASITGTIQPGVLRRALSGEAWESGLTARFLLAMPPRRPKVWTEAEVPPEVEEAYALMLRCLLDQEFARDDEGKPVPFVVKMTPAAKDLWCRFYDEWARQQAAAEGALGAAYAKLEAYAARLMLLHHCASRCIHGDTCDPIEPESVEAAVTLVRWFGYETRRIYALLTEEEADSRTRKLVEFLHRHGRVRARQVQRAFAAEYPTAEDATVALDGLVRAKLARVEVQPSGPEGGRPTRYYELLPGVTEAGVDGEGD